MDEVNFMINPVLPVRLRSPLQNEKQVGLKLKDEDVSFLTKMNEESLTDNKTEEKLKETKEENVSQTQVAVSDIYRMENDNIEAPFTLKEKIEEKQKMEKLLLEISDQALAMEQLRMQPELLYQYIQKIQELYKKHGNIKIDELPAKEIQQLQAFLKDFNIKNVICLEDTIQMMLEKVTSLENMLCSFESIQKESCDITKVSALGSPMNQADFENQQMEKNDMLKEAFANTEDKEKVQKEALDGLEENLESKEDPIKNKSIGESNINSILAGNDAVVKKGDVQLKMPKVSLSDLGNKMEAKVEALQKFIVKQERVLFQLNPEKLGTLTVYMKKQGSHIQVHVEMDKQDAKKRVEMIFDELKFKLKEKEIHIELSYANRDQQRQQQEREQAQKQRKVVMKKAKRTEEDFAGLLEG